MDLVTDFWPLIAGAIAGLVWLVRLEAGMIQNRKDIRKMEAQRAEDQKRADAQRDKMDDNIKEIRADIKQMLLLLSSKEDRK